MRNSITAIVLTLLIAGCSRDGSTENVVVVPKQEGAAPGMQLTLPVGLKETRKICGQCHGLPNPTQYHPAAWPSVVARMEALIVKNGRIMPTAAEKEAILTYLQSGWKQ